MSALTFASLLADAMRRAGLSQSKLAERAGFNHSYVSRLMSGQRMPAREAVERFADALALTDAARDALLAAAGFRPGSVGVLLASPALGDLDDLLRSADEATRLWLIDGIEHLLAGARARRRGAHVVALRTERTEESA